ncbi:hypothetical protein GCM10009120_31780 [Sphingobacterium siyangense subsp. cladoniae]|uniref:hypothetical protein n=1 Tax=Sphingobacterium siyangense TaxID=459529 RepID=UPI0031F933C4
MSESLFEAIIKLLTVNNISQFLQFAIPIMISIWGIYFIRKSKFYFIEKSSVKLYQDIVKSIDGLSITFNEEQIRENLILFSGSIIYSGHNDIKADEIDREITIYSRDTSARWLHFEIRNSSDFFSPEYRIEENKVILNRSLWKKDDFIDFSGLIDSPDNNIKISFRIYNVNNKVIRLKESNTTFYKANAIAGIIAFTLTFPNTIPSKDLSKTQPQKDSLFQKRLEIDEKIFINEKVVDMGKLQKSRQEIEVKDYNFKVKNGLDSLNKLTEIYKEKPTDKNKIEVLKQALDVSRIPYPLQNEYDRILLKSYKITDSLLVGDNMDTNKVYKINDTTQIKFAYNTLKTSPNDKKFEFLEFFLKLAPLGFILFVIYQAYNYLYIKKLTKILRKKEI